jgi:hypothetical protein
MRPLLSMRKLRGRRIILLLAGALPLLAKDDIPIVSTAAVVVSTTSTETTTRVVSDGGDGEHDLDLSRLRSAATAQHEQQESLHTTFDDQSIPKNGVASWAGFPFELWSDEFGQGHYNTVIPLRPPPFLPSDVAFGGNLNQTLNEKPPERIRLENGTEDNEVKETMTNTSTTNESSIIGEEASAIESQGNANTTANSVEVEKNITDTAVNITTTTTTTTQTKTTTEEEIPAATTEKATTTTNKVVSTDADDNTVKDATGTIQRVVVDYASKSAGALILEKSSDFQGTSNLLNSDKDQYAIIPCEHASKFVVVGLSEDILVKQVVLANYERYSSQIKEFNVLGSQTIGHWVDLGTYQAALAAGKQTFDLKEPSWARYLKFRFLSHFGDEHYCTVSQISVHGSTMVQGFHEQWKESEAEEDASADSTTAEDTVISTAIEPIVLSSDEAVAPPIATNEAIDSATADKASSSSVQCVVSKLNGVCPDALGFEQSMQAFNYSDFKLLGALPLASIYLASSQSAKSNSSSSEPSLPHELDCTAIVKTLHESRDVTHLIASRQLSEQATGTLERSLRLTNVSPIIHRIQNMIKSFATGIDVNLKLDNAMGNKRLSSSKTVSGDVNVEAGTEKIKPAGAPSVSKPAVKEEKKEEATPLQPPVPPKEVSPTVTSTVKPQTPPATGVEPVVTKVPVPEKKEETAHESLHETGAALANVLKRFPSAACLGELDFAKFKAKILSARASNTGNGGQSGGGGTVEPIFKKLADEIRTLQTSVSVHDQFAKSSIACYQRVMLDLVVELEVARVEQDARISKIEQELSRATQWTAYFKGIFSPVVYGVSSTLEMLVSSVIFREGKTFLDCVQWAVGFVLTVFVYRVMISTGSRKRKLPS